MYNTVLVRDGGVTPLSQVPPQSKDATLDEQEDEEEQSDEEARQRRRENAKELKRYGRQSAMSSALGRPLYDFEMDDEDDSLTDDDDDGLDDDDFDQLMSIMRQMDNFGDGGFGEEYDYY
jgi:hypothetical protein